ncbi:MAG: tyrosine-type recombinase/integrase [Myxococcota bacterium]
MCTTGSCVITAHIAELARRLETRGYAPATVKQYTGLLATFFEYLHVHGIDELRAVQPEHVRAYAAELQRRRLSSSTRVQSLRAVVRLFSDLVERGVLLLSPTSRIEIPHRKVVLPARVPTKLQMRQLLAAPSTRRNTDIRDRAMLEVLYGSALRISELCGLTVDDADLDDGLLRVLGKGNKERVVPLSEAARTSLHDYLTTVRPRWTRRRPLERALFLSNRGGPLSTNTARCAIWNLCRKARLARISPHAIRHAAATHMVAAGADVRQVQELLGHVSINSTQIYTRVVPMDVKATHERTHPREREP